MFWLIAVAPWLVLALAALAIEWRPTRGWALWLTQGEGHPVEQATFVCLALAALIGPAALLSGAAVPMLFHRQRGAEVGRHGRPESGDVAGALYSAHTAGGLLGVVIGGYARRITRAGAR